MITNAESLSTILLITMHSETRYFSKIKSQLGADRIVMPDKYIITNIVFDKYGDIDIFCFHFDIEIMQKRLSSGVDSIVIDDEILENKLFLFRLGSYFNSKKAREMFCVIFPMKKNTTSTSDWFMINFKK